LNESGEDVPLDILISCRNDSAEHEAVDYLGLPDGNPENLFTPRYSSLPLLVEVDFNIVGAKNWILFAEKAARFFRVGDSEYRPRIICLFMISPPAIPPVRASPGLRNYVFWNPLTWEEVRLLVSDTISESENPLTRAWKVSTYAGASCLDPSVVSLLTTKQPTSLDGVKRIIQDCLNDDDSDPGTYEYSGRFHRESRWDVPSALIPDWQTGYLVGTTLDRGASLSLTGVRGVGLDRHINQAVWREQIAGLFPLLMEMTFIISQALTNTVGREWKSYLEEGEGKDTAEPGAILFVFSKYRLGRLPNDIYRILKDLKDVRNSLAHLEPIEYRNIQQIYDKFKRLNGIA